MSQHETNTLFMVCGFMLTPFFDWSDFMMERYILANALANIDFDLLTSNNERSLRGYWGEIMELRFPSGVIFIYIDENVGGFIKIYRKSECEIIKHFLITRDNLKDKMNEAVNFAKKALQ